MPSRIGEGKRVIRPLDLKDFSETTEQVNVIVNASRDSLTTQMINIPLQIFVIGPEVIRKPMGKDRAGRNRPPFIAVTGIESFGVGV